VTGVVEVAEEEGLALTAASLVTFKDSVISVKTLFLLFLFNGKLSFILLCYFFVVFA
jgi:hypothetical protein